MSDLITRAFSLLDYEVSRSGDGRTVTAYAATFGDPYEVRDQFGHYMESINRAAFNRFLGRNGISRVGVYFNHALTPLGTPSERWSVPVGTPVEIKPDGKGLLTVTRYATDPDSELVLQMWKDGRVKGQSFRGAVFQSAPPRPYGGGGLSLIERTELGLTEYGPTGAPVNLGADLVAIRSEVLTFDPTTLSAEEREHLLAALNVGPPAPPPSGDPAQDPPPAGDPPAEEAPDPAHTTHLLALANAQRRRRAS